MCVGVSVCVDLNTWFGNFPLARRCHFWVWKWCVSVCMCVDWETWFVDWSQLRGWFLVLVWVQKSTHERSPCVRSYQHQSLDSIKVVWLKVFGWSKPYRAATGLRSLALASQAVPGESDAPSWPDMGLGMIYARQGRYMIWSFSLCLW